MEWLDWDVGYKPTSPCSQYLTPLMTNFNGDKATNRIANGKYFREGLITRKLATPVNTSAFFRTNLADSV
jgi:hypothetical protein